MARYLAVTLLLLLAVSAYAYAEGPAKDDAPKSTVVPSALTPVANDPVLADGPGGDDQIGGGDDEDAAPIGAPTSATNYPPVPENDVSPTKATSGTASFAGATAAASVAAIVGYFVV